jgi:hypothetical protein
MTVDEWSRKLKQGESKTGDSGHSVRVLSISEDPFKEGDRNMIKVVLEYTCGGGWSVGSRPCSHVWRKTVHEYRPSAATEGVSANPRKCTACEKLDSAETHLQMADKLRRQANAILAKRKDRA